ncbi:hypothetical protein [Acetobacter cibinongensis]|uniref:hypothetical protein n=1 Tax=Acetobacter cibinongensis TaxID=146475 RepID=UPI0013FDAF37|nr:hypothetical protein [Acetobacter cibinongensis]
MESSLYRWTSGNAELPLQDSAACGKEPSVLSLQIVSSGPYVLDAPIVPAEQRQVG